MKRDTISTGDRVVTSGGREIGSVKKVRGNLLNLGRVNSWMPETAIQDRHDSVIQLRPEYDYLGGPGKSNGPKKAFQPLSLALMASTLATIFALRDKDRRRKLFGSVRSLFGEARGQVSQRKTSTSWSAGSNGIGTSTGFTPGRTPETNPSSLKDIDPPDTPPFSSLDLSERSVSALERDVAALVTVAFPDRDLKMNAIAVHKTEGGEVGTLRFTVDDMASSDLELARLEKPMQSAETLASEVIEDLREQLKP